MKKTLIVFLLAVSFSFVKADQEIIIPDCAEAIQGIDISSSGNTMIAWTQNQLHQTKNRGGSWVSIKPSELQGTLIGATIVNDLVTFVASSTKIYRTINGGQSWLPVEPSNARDFMKIKFVNQCIYVLGAKGTIFRSLDFGNNWESYTVIFNGNFSAIDFFENVDSGGMVSRDEQGIWTTTNGGMEWWPQSLPQDATGYDLSISGMYTFVIGVGYVGFPEPQPLILRIYEGGWEVSPIEEPGYKPVGIKFQGSIGAAVFNKNTALLCKASNWGMSWRFESKTYAVYCMTMSGSDIYLGSNAGTIYRSDATVGISQNSQIFSTYQLSQNYPNPFNPETKINFSIPENSKIKLTVFDIVGREIQVLENSFLSAGSYTYSFNATNLSTGTYLYRLETPGFIQEKKMMLIK